MTRTRRQKTLAAGRRRANQGNCPQPYKDPYPNHQAAENALNEAWASHRKNRRMPLRTYHCECGAWHLTKTPDRKKAAA